MVVIEDCRSTGAILAEYLDPIHLRRLVSEEEFPSDPWIHPRSQEPFPASNDERSEGQLRHLTAALFDVDGNLVPPTVVVYPQSEEALEELYDVTREPDIETRWTRLMTILSALGDPHQMILVVDLALLVGEGDRMSGVNAILPNVATREVGDDPRPALRDLTGFRIVETLGYTMPVIATTYMNHPLLLQHCQVSGAYAVVRKPVEQCDSSDQTEDVAAPRGLLRRLLGRRKKVEAPARERFDMETARERSLSRLETGAKRADDMLSVVVVQYATTLVAAVLTAVAYMHTVQARLYRWDDLDDE